MRKNIQCRRKEYIVTLKLKCWGNLKKGSFNIDKFKFKPKTYVISAFNEEEIIKEIVKRKPGENDVFPVKNGNYFVFSKKDWGKWPYWNKCDLFWIKVIEKENIKKSWYRLLLEWFCLKFYWICLWWELFGVMRDVCEIVDDRFGK